MKQDWPNMANSFGKERGEGRAPEGVVKEFEFEEYQAACGGWHRCSFKSWGHRGLAEARSTFEGTSRAHSWV